MNEKVFGFKKRTVCPDAMSAHCEICRQKCFSVPESKLVPVVSVKWLEKALRKYEKRTDLLLAAKKEAYGNRTVLGEAENIIEKKLTALKKMAMESD